MRKMKNGPATADLLWARRPPPRDQKNTGPREAATVDGEPKESQRSTADEPGPRERRRQKPSHKKTLDGQRKNGLGGLDTRDPTGARKGGGRRRRGGRPRLADGTNGCRDDVLEQGTAWSSEEEVFGYGRTGAASEAAPKPPAEDAASGEKQQGSSGAGGARDAPSAEPAPLAGRMPK